jgi:hypothetical protein
MSSGAREAARIELLASTAARRWPAAVRRDAHRSGVRGAEPLKRHASLDQIDIVELNGCLASQLLYRQRELQFSTRSST